MKQTLMSAVAAFPIAVLAFMYKAGSGERCCRLSQLLIFAVMSFRSVWQAGINTLIQSHHHLIMFMTVLAVLPPALTPCCSTCSWHSAFSCCKNLNKQLQTDKGCMPGFD